MAAVSGRQQQEGEEDKEIERGREQLLLDRIAELEDKVARLQLSATAAAAAQASTSQHDPAARTSRPKENNKKSKKQHKIEAYPEALARRPRRHIALLFSYEGWDYAGLAYQPTDKNTGVQARTVELALLDALHKARLVPPPLKEDDASDGLGCGLERCGRTDAGVSSSGQVANLWVRSDLADPMRSGFKMDSDDGAADDDDGGMVTRPKPRSKGWPAPHEINYVNVLNKNLPASIRIHAWSPVRADFSSRFSCVWRHYKYFFSTSPGAPLLKAAAIDHGAAYASEGLNERLAKVDWGTLELDVDLMRDAVARLVGEHDFRNLCKPDPQKQLATHVRTVLSASIDKLQAEGDDLFVLNLRGASFLYNQVRNIVAILLMVGARLEPPSVVSQLINTTERPLPPEHSDQPLELLDRKPNYELADDLPLVLWQCGFNKADFSWRIDNQPVGDELQGLEDDGRTTFSRLETFKRSYLDMHESYTRERLRAIILKHHLSAFSHFAPSTDEIATSEELSAQRTLAAGVLAPLGAGRFSRSVTHQPLMSRPRSERPEDLNARWASGRGARKMEQRERDKEESAARRVANEQKRTDAMTAWQRDARAP